jgi:two-component system sensor histidine kinase KdpD
VIFSNVIERTAPAARSHTIKIDLDEDAPLARLDSRLIAEALAHLVENAAKYSPPGTDILLKARIDENRLLISVKDQGEGIEPDERNRVFDKFYRSARHDGRRAEGTGMGLAIARGIIEAHGGSIWVESAPGRGATFSFMIPVETRRDVKSIATAEEH